MSSGTESVKLDKLNALVSFVRAVDLGSFSAAAIHLGISQPAVSQQVRALEESLGTRLLNRTTRRLALTEAGERYYAYASDIVERIAEADRSIQSAEAQMSGSLAIGLPIGFSESTLGNFLIEFKKNHPCLVLDVSLSDTYVDIVKERLDVAIRVGEIKDETLIVRRLGIIERCLIASPEYLDRAGRPQQPSDLGQHDYLFYKGIATGFDVPLVGRDGEHTTTRIKPAMMVNNSTTLYDATLAGLGIGLNKRWLMETDIREGRLEEVLPEWTYPSHPIHAVYPSNRFIPLKVRRFVVALADFLETNGAFKSKIATETRSKVI